jgi:hypothetical protein
MRGTIVQELSRNQMRIGIVHFMAYPSTMSGTGPILESIDELIRDEFFDVLEITHIDEIDPPRSGPPKPYRGYGLAYGAQPITWDCQLNCTAAIRSSTTLTGYNSFGPGRSC